jgi:hypothetical protein
MDIRVNDNKLLRYCKLIDGQQAGKRAEKPARRGRAERGALASDAVEYYFYSLRRHAAQAFAMDLDGVHLLLLLLAVVLGLVETG